MPIIKIDELSNEFNMRDLFIDAQLTASSSVSSGNQVKRDFLGKKTFSTSFYRENLGFGITDINIEVNTSLQPIVEFTFKDLYGNLMLGNNTDPELDYSILFDWPPPKFIFTFKGYLGRPVQWVLSLKKTSTSFGETDGSYEIKASFVPNQWGFFADIPFAYLLAVKSLRLKEKGLVTPAQGTNIPATQVNSIFDLIKIGKTVNIKTQEASKEFDVVLKQVGLLKNGRIIESISNDKLLAFDKPITGKVNNLQINGFHNITVKKPAGTQYANEAAIKNFINSAPAQELVKINEYLLYIADVGSLGGDANLSYENFKKLIPSQVSLVNDPKIALLDENITKIDEAIKQKLYNSSKDLLGLVTIGEVMRNIAGDTAYVLKRILQAGLEGYQNNQESRNSDVLIGKYFPLLIDKTTDEEVPAIKKIVDSNIRNSSTGANVNENNGSNNASPYGVENYEMKFVREFIEAIATGIARDAEVGSESNIGNLDGDLKKRINNLEILRPNPYKPYYSSISENVMIRSGIAAFLTRNEDPNKPGPYGAVTLVPGDTYDDPDSIAKLADADSENITESIIQGLLDEDLAQLKRFAFVFDKMFDERGNIIKDDGTKIATTSLQNLPTDDVSNVILDLEYTLPDGGSPVKVRTLLESLFNGQGTNAQVPFVNLPENAPNHEGSTVQVTPQILNSLVVNPIFVPQTPTNPLTSRLTAFSSDFRPVYGPTGALPGATAQANPMGFIDTTTYTAIKLVNNGVPYFKAYDSQNTPDYMFVIMEGQDALDSRSANNSNFDNEYRTDKDNNDPEETASFWEDRTAGVNKQPKGFVTIDRYFEKDNTTTPTQLIRLVNSAITRNMVYDYNAMTNSLNLVSDPDFNVNSGVESFRWKNPLLDPNSFIGNNNNINGVPAQDLSVSVYATPTDVKVVWWLFGNNKYSEYQRIYIKTMCKNILAKLRRIQENRSELISKILGNTVDIQNVIYKEFHNIFHQWESVLSAPDKLEVLDHYGDKGFHVEGNVSASYADLTFIYDFPLANIKQLAEAVSVRDSLISLEPLYKYDSRTTVLNMIQNLCSLNNFMFIPMPGFPGLQGQNDIYKPSPYTIPDSVVPLNYFYISFMPTLESRAKMADQKTQIGDKFTGPPPILADALEVKFGSPTNHIIKSVRVGTEENKNTAESILNVQKLVDKDNQNRVVATNCSTLPMIEGRSYKASFEMLGNAQVFPMQYFYVTNMPLFYGLYQIIKVRHSITPNNMNTSVEGIRMRFDVSEKTFGSIKPITLGSLQKLNAFTVTPDNPDLNNVQIVGNGQFTQPNVASPTPNPPPALLAADSLLTAKAYVLKFEKLFTLNNPGLFSFLVYKWVTELGYQVDIRDAQRTRAEQEYLFNTNQTTVNPATYPGRQFFHENAIDVNLITNLGRGKRIGKTTPASEWAAAVGIAYKYGFIWGGTFQGFYDPVHFSLVSASENKIKIVRDRITSDPDWIRLGGELTFGKA